MASIAHAVRTVKQPIFPPEPDDDRAVGVIGSIDLASIRPRRVPPQPAAQRITLTSGPRPAERLRAYLLERDYCGVYRDDIVRAITAADDPVDAMIELVAQGYLELEDMAGARRAYGID